MKSTLKLLGQKIFRTGERRHIIFQCSPEREMEPGSRIWLIFDLRQDPGFPQVDNPEQANFLSAYVKGRKPLACQTYSTRTLDLYPRVPEFFYACEISLPEGLPGGEVVTISLGGERGWQLPNFPIQVFRFWVLAGDGPELTFTPTGYRTYRAFNVASPEKLQDELGEVAIRVEGAYPAPAPENTRPTPGILWGDIHGMAFNQRPLDDFYRYARVVAKYDFVAAMLFSYNVCVDGIWEQVQQAAARWTEPGKFLAIVGVEAATVPDGSHRNAHFFDPRGVPPIFCEDRPPAQEQRFRQRLHADTVFCDTLEQYYETVARYGGIVTGHFHTWDYQQEILAEIWQKQLGPEGDEAHIFDLLNQGKLLGIIAGSDTHDSMPGNPLPEPHCPQPAGFMAVLSEQLSPGAIKEAISQRRVYGTTGARIILKVTSSGEPMGSVLPPESPRHFEIDIEGSGPLARIALIRNGECIQASEANTVRFRSEMLDRPPNVGQPDWYLVKVTQADGHRAWSSPFFFREPSGNNSHA